MKPSNTHKDQKPSLKKKLKRTKIKFPKWTYLVFAVLCFAQYTQTWSYEYVLDDKIVITDNQFTNQGFSGIRDILSTESFQGYFGEQKDLLPGARYRPLSLVTFAIENQFFGNNPAASHMINIVLYWITGVLLFLIMKAYFPLYKGNQWYFNSAFLLVLLWLAHPLHTEAVANIKGRDEIMSLLFSLAAWWSSYQWILKNKNKYLFSAFGLLFLGLLSKESAITFVGIIPFALYFLKKRSTLKKLVIVTAPLLGASIIYLLIRYAVIGYFLDSGKVLTDIMNNPFIGMDIADKYATIFYTLGLYVKLSFIPHPLTHDYYPYHIPVLGWGDYRAWGSLLLYIILAATTVIGLRKKSKVALAIGIYIMSLSVASNLLINVGTFMNERFIFAASIGPCLIIIYAAKLLYEKYKTSNLKWIGPAMSYIIIATFAVLSFVRIPAWKNLYTLNDAAIKVSKNSARANSFMATELYKKIKSTSNREEKKSMIEDAEHYARRATEILPNYQNANLMKAGIATERYLLKRDLDPLLQSFKEVAENRPEIGFMHEYFEYLKDRADNNKLCQFYYDTGYTMMHQRQQKNDWAAKYLAYGYELCPDDYKINLALGSVYKALGNQRISAQYIANAENLKPKLNE